MSIEPIVHHPLAVQQQPAGASRIMEFAANLNAAASAMEVLIDTPFIPLSFWPLPKGVAIRDFPDPKLQHPRESPAEHARRREIACASASAAVLYGDELGYGTIAALSSIYVVRGRPGLYAEAMDALVKSHGHDIAVEELTDSRCVMRGRRKGDADWQFFAFTMDRARKAGYVKQNPKYTDDPQSMLKARATSIACRSIAPDVLKGIASVEEIADEVAVGVEVQPTRTRTVRRAEPPALPAEQAPKAAPQRPAPSGPPLPGEEEQQGEPGITDPQMRKLGVLFAQLGVKGKGEREDRLTIASKVANRPLTTSKELTLGEAKVLIDTLESIASLPQADGDFAIDDMLGRRDDLAVGDDPDARAAVEQDELEADGDDEYAEQLVDEAEADHG